MGDCAELVVAVIIENVLQGNHHLGWEYCKIMNRTKSRLRKSRMARHIVTAIQSHHYYDVETRDIAVRKCYRALVKGGIFMTFENIKMSTEESDAIALNRWGQFLLDHGWTPEEVKAHQARRGVEMFPITIEQHLEMIKNAGFKSVNILWASYMQAGFWAVKYSEIYICQRITEKL